MTDLVLTGTRVRNRRLDLGLRQADVARELGVSASYLNLIEHNRRRIGARMLADLARILKVDAELLDVGTAASITGPISEAAAAFGDISVEDARVEELIARFPGWAALVGAQAARIAALEARTRALGDRLTHDTQIATSLHEVISTATAIRSTASILAETPDLDTDWQARFHSNIDADAARLAQSSQALLGFLDMEIETGGGLQEVSALEQAEAAQAVRGFYLPQSETGEAVSFEGEVGAVASVILDQWADQGAADAALLPLAEFQQAARALAYDPARLAARFNAPLEAVMRRLCHMPEDAQAPPMGLAVCDSAGVVTFQKPVLDFRLPRSGAACPLWPLYQALNQPGRALRRIVQLPGAVRTPFECFAIAAPVGEVVYGAEPRIVASMLVRPAKSDGAAGTVGPGCRVCPVSDCSARRHPSVL